jgi:hypothetical protein
MKEGEHLNDLDAGGSIVLKCIFLEIFMVLTTVVMKGRVFWDVGLSVVK